MFNWLFKKASKDEFDHHKSSVQTALNSAKQDILNISKWVKHLNRTDSEIKDDVESFSEELASVKNELAEIKEMLAEQTAQPLLKQRQTAAHKQTAVYGVQTAVQTAVQVAFLDRLSISEKALIMILLNSDMKLSYEDLATMMGKDTATIRGQINNIKQKAPGIIEEQIEKNNKKRLFIPDKIKGILLRKAKMRVKQPKIEEIEEQ